MLPWSRTASPPPPSGPQPCAEHLCSGRRQRGRVRSPRSRNSAAPSTPRWETPDLLGSREDRQGTGDHPGRGSRSHLGPGRAYGPCLPISYLKPEMSGCQCQSMKKRGGKGHLSEAEGKACLRISVRLIRKSIQTKICLISVLSRWRITRCID